MLSGIYIIQNCINNKCYTGSSFQIEKRWIVHKSQLSNSKHQNPHLQNAWNKYGEAAFKFWIAEEVPDKNQLLEREQWWLDMFESVYNIRKLANNNLGLRYSLPFRHKDSLHKINIGNALRNKKHSTEHKLNNSIAQTGKKYSKEYILLQKNNSFQKKKKFCPSNHEYSDLNTRITLSNHRICRTCDRLRQRKVK